MIKYIYNTTIKILATIAVLTILSMYTDNLYTLYLVTGAFLITVILIDILTKKQRDLNKESACLNHCVRRYADDIIDNNLKIFFVRIDPDIPFITAEVKNGKITQFRGKDNLLSHIDDNLVKKCRKVLETYLSL